MKNKILVTLFIFGLAASIFAHGRDRLPHGEKVSVTGSLTVAHGMPALQSGDNTYLLGGLRRLIGFVEGLKEGAQVTVEGYAIPIPRDSRLKVLSSSQMILNGKTYDLSVPGGKGFTRGIQHHRRHNSPAQPGYNERHRRVPKEHIW